MSLRTAITSLLIGSLLVGEAAAALSPDLQRMPVVLNVGDHRIDPARIQPYSAVWKETLVNVLNQVIERGMWDDRVTRERAGDRELIVRRITVNQPDGAMRERYQTTVDARTFEPVRSEWQNNRGQSYTYDYAPRRVRGERVTEPAAAPRPINASTTTRAFDYYGGMMELFLATLPKQAGSVLTFPALLATTGADADQGGIHWPLVEVFPEEVVPGSQTTRAARVEANTRYGFYKVWVTDAPPYVVRTILILPQGGRITYELISSRVGPEPQARRW